MKDQQARRAQTAHRLEEFRNCLGKSRTLLAGKACAYATGSYGRLEASGDSDLDLFIVSLNEEMLGREGKSLLSRLDEICVKAELIQMTRRFGIRDFSGEGEYLTHFTLNQLKNSLGTQDDDKINTFTARLLLLLESRPLLEEPVYYKTIDEVLAVYWQDFEDHSNEFIPAFLCNDILRLWRTFCVNYESRSRRQRAEGRCSPEAATKRRIKNYKLKHSRIITCFSALLLFLFIHDRSNTVTPEDARMTVRMTPTERLEYIFSQSSTVCIKNKISELLGLYNDFLENSSLGETELENRFATQGGSEQYLQSAYEFGDAIFEALQLVGKQGRFLRLLMV